MKIPGAHDNTLKDGTSSSYPRIKVIFTQKKWLIALLLTLVFALYIGYLVILLLYGQTILQFPFDYDQGEGFELYDAIRLAGGQGIYLNNAVFPFYSSNYPPVYRLLLTPFVGLLGPHLWVGRAITLICTLITSFLIGIAAYQGLRKDNRNSSSLYSHYIATIAVSMTALAFLAANYVYEIAPLARAHLPMVMFAFAGILCLDFAFARESDGRWPGVVLGIALLVIAGFTKLQAVDALAAGFGFLLLRKPRWFLITLVCSSALTVAIVVIINALTGGQFWLNVVLANVNEYDIQQTWLTYGQWFRLEGVLIVCSVAFVIWDIVRAVRLRSIKPITIWSLYFLTGTAMGMLTGKWGAGPTYLIAAIAAACVCTLALLWRISRVISRYKPDLSPFSALGLLCAIVFAIQAALNVHLPSSGRLFGTIARAIGVAGQSSYPPYPYYDSVGYTQLGHFLDPADTANGWELVRIAREAKGPVWSEEAMITLLAGKEVITNPTQLYNLSKSNMLDTSQMLQMIRSRSFGAVIFRAQFYPQDVLIAIGQNYHWVRAVRMNGFDYQVLYPNIGAP